MLTGHHAGRHSFKEFVCNVEKFHTLKEFQSVPNILLRFYKPSIYTPPSDFSKIKKEYKHARETRFFPVLANLHS